MSVKRCNSYDCRYMTKSGNGCNGDIEIVDGICITYFKAKEIDTKITLMHRYKGGAMVNNRGAFR